VKLTDIQKDKVRRAYNEASAVLSEIKRKNLSGKELDAMRVLEQAVQNLEAFQIITK
jgi:hypothetical protein